MARKKKAAEYSLSPLDKKVSLLRVCQSVVAIVDTMLEQGGVRKQKYLFKLVLGGSILRFARESEYSQAIGVTLISNAISEMIIAPMFEMQRIYQDILRSWWQENKSQPVLTMNHAARRALRK